MPSSFEHRPGGSPARLLSSRHCGPRDGWRARHPQNCSGTAVLPELHVLVKRRRTCPRLLPLLLHRRPRPLRRSRLYSGQGALAHVVGKRAWARLASDGGQPSDRRRIVAGSACTRYWPMHDQRRPLQAFDVGVAPAEWRACASPAPHRQVSYLSARQTPRSSWISVCAQSSCVPSFEQSSAPPQWYCSTASSSCQLGQPRRQRTSFWRPWLARRPASAALATPWASSE